MSDLPVRTIENVRPRLIYDRLPPGWTGNALDILRLPYDTSARLSAVLEPEWIDHRTQRLFAAWCARRALARLENPSPIATEAWKQIEAYANGAITAEQLTDVFLRIYALVNTPGHSLYEYDAYEAVISACNDDDTRYAYYAAVATARLAPEDDGGPWRERQALIHHLIEILEETPHGKANDDE